MFSPSVIPAVIQRSFRRVDDILSDQRMVSCAHAHLLRWISLKDKKTNPSRYEKTRSYALRWAHVEANFWCEETYVFSLRKISNKNKCAKAFMTESVEKKRFDHNSVKGLAVRKTQKISLPLFIEISTSTCRPKPNEWILTNK